MNNLSEFERIIKDKVDGFEYPYDSSSWKDLKKAVPGKSNFWGYAALFSLAVIATLSIIYVYNNDDVNGICKKNITESVNKSFEPALDSQDPEKVIETIANSSDKEVSVKNDTQTENVTVETTKVEIADKNNIEAEHNISNESIIADLTQNNQTGIKPVKPNASFVCDKKEGCVPLKVRFMPVEISDTIIYSWDFGDGTYSTEKSPYHVYDDDGSYSVTLNVKYYRSETVVPNRQPNMIKVHELPVAQFSWTNNNNSYSFENLSTGATKYKWVLSDTSSTEENLNKIFRVNGKYQVQLIAINKYGCKEVVTNEIEVKIEFPIFLANSFSPNGDADNDFFGPQVDKPADYYIEFIIYNMKTNQKVFEAKGNANDVAWNGIDKYSQKSAEAGYYYYQMIAKDKYGNTQELTDKFKLLR